MAPARIALVALALALAAGCQGPPTFAEIDPETYLDTMDHRRVVYVREGVDPAAVAARHGLVPFLIFEPNALFSGFAAIVPPYVEADLEDDDDVDGMVADRYVHAYEDDETNGFQRIEANLNAVVLAGGGTTVDVDVAILDTGIGPHSELNIVGGRRFVTGGNVNDYDDGDGHGTHVSGTVGAFDNGYGVVGMAPGVRLWAGKVLSDRGSGTLSGAAQGVLWASGLDIPIINMSLGVDNLGPYTQDCPSTSNTLHLAICSAVSSGTTVIVAAGNESDDASNHLPAAFDEVITVSALADFDGQPGGLTANTGLISDPTWSPSCNHADPTEADDSLADFSNYGPDVDLMAPGLCIVSTYPPSPPYGEGYAWSSGTSMAAPHVTGVAAVYMHNHPLATPAQVKAALIERGNKRPCASADGSCSDDPDGMQEPLVFLGHLDDSFELDTAGTTPSYVTDTSGDVSAAIIASDADASGDGGDQCLAFDSNTDSGDPDYSRLQFCLPDTADTYFRASFSLKAQSFVNWNPIAIVGTSPTPLMYWWWLDETGAIADDQAVGSLMAATWHRISIEIDRAAGTASFAVDGVGTTSLLSTWDDPTDPMKCLVLTTWPDQVQDIAVDDVLITSDD